MGQGVQYICYIDDTGFYLGDAEQMSVYLDNTFEDLHSTWVPAQADGTLTLIRTTDVQALWKALGTLAERFKSVNQDALMDQTIHLFMPCGYQARYIAFDDLPWESTRCGCGDANHWLIWYTGKVEG